MSPRLKTYVLLFIAVILLTPIVYGQKVGDCLTGNCENGKGVKLLDKKDKYEGEFVNRKMEGVGVIWTKKGRVKEMGLFSNDQYVEHVYFNQPNAATIHYDNGDIFWGSIIDGMRQGEGIYQWQMTSKDGPNAFKRYKGNWTNDKMNGEGSIILNSGSVISKKMVNGLLEESYKRQQASPKKYEYIKYTYQNGATYEGGMVNDDKQGFGIFNYIDGRKYIGSFDQDMIDGVGVLYDKNNVVLQSGRFSNNVLKESFTVNEKTDYIIRYPFGSKYIGQLVNGKRNGNGTYFYKRQLNETVTLKHFGTYTNYTDAHITGGWKDNLESGVMTMKTEKYSYSEYPFLNDLNEVSKWLISKDRIVTTITGNYVSNYFEGFGSIETSIVVGSVNEYEGVLKYIGNLLLSKPHGKGKMYKWSNGEWYLENEGDFRDGAFIGSSN